jgi:hypothetical protein
MSAQIPADTDIADAFNRLRARSEAARVERVARIHRVDTKLRSCANFGNDGGVGTKSFSCEPFGNDDGLVGFIRVRKRKLKGGHPQWRAYNARAGRLATTSASFDLVRAVRINGKPRHEFLLGLGSQKDRDSDNEVVWFWVHAVRRMKRHDLTDQQRRRLAAEMVRKGARLPTVVQCRKHDCVVRDPATLDEVIAIVEAASLPNVTTSGELVTTRANAEVVS